MEKILGIDEAGRGPVLGPMCIGGVLCTPLQISYLQSLNVTDSKKLTPKKRVFLYPKILENCIGWTVKKVDADVIDRYILEYRKKTLNTLEMEVMVEIIAEMRPDRVYIDAIGSKPLSFVDKIYTMLKEKKIEKIPEIIAENNGDAKFTIVGAASIIAKVERDREILQLAEKYVEYGDMGSGYAGDRRTVEFLRRYIESRGRPPPFARKSWATTKRLMEKYGHVTHSKQTSLTDFLR